MALQLNAASGYDDVYWTNVLKKVQTVIQDSTSYGNIYIAPQVQNTAAQSIRIWSTNSFSETLKETEWTRLYEVNICLYMITQNRSERFYKTFYEQSEILYQIMVNNDSVDGALGWYNGQVDDIIYNDLNEIEFAVDGLNKASFNFSCYVTRATTGTIIL
tara:strand:+ start:6281 stop:6760 length:480 start_codon:yes stop_codon:yes gene_type:complete